MARPVLTLSIFEPRYVAIGPPGAEANYELRWPGAMSLVDLDLLSALRARLSALQKRDPSVGDAESSRAGAELIGIIDELVGMVLLAPKDVIGRLADGHKLAILAAFQEGPTAPGEEKPRPGFRTPRRRVKATGAQPSPSTGGSGSPA